MKRRLSIITHNKEDNVTQQQIPTTWPVEYTAIPVDMNAKLAEHLKKRKLSVIQPSLYTDMSPSLHIRYFEPTPQTIPESALLHVPQHFEVPEQIENVMFSREMNQLKQLNLQVHNSKQLLSQLQQLHVRSTTMAFSEPIDHLSFLSKQQDQLDQLQSIIDEHNRQILQLERQMH
jgi:hypothetical protein